MSDVSVTLGVVTAIVALITAIINFLQLRRK